jgi:hypothetical protein
MNQCINTMSQSQCNVQNKEVYLDQLKMEGGVTSLAQNLGGLLQAHKVHICLTILFCVHIGDYCLFFMSSWFPNLKEYS